ncbi:10415_t:CDS:2 [Cetraspora pellucida]|uniref:10415_t:CDS:1 n=1 Tax=Cetraspora pellucida TaxID=1433469 RepID=A0ACA9NKG9_9GLOM|nr:10415_t:CDS:2 [Cetraspora pellucida]
MSLEKVIESYDSTITLIDNNKEKEIIKIDVCLKYVYDVSHMLKKHNFNIDNSKKMILSDKDKDLDVLFEQYQILIHCEFKLKKKEFYHDKDMLSSTLSNDKYKEHIKINQDHSDNAVKKVNNLKIITCRTDNLVKKIADHIILLKQFDDKFN